MTTRWFQSEEEQKPLDLVYVYGVIWRDKDNQFYFGDETGADVCGPYASADEAQRAVEEYAKTL